MKVGSKDGFDQGRLGGTGLRGLDDPNVPRARADAVAHEADRVDWRNPARTLDHLTQIDSDRGAQAGGNDAVRCGAANLVAGAVAMGPAQTRRALQAVEQRNARLLPMYERLRNEQPPGTPARRYLDTVVTQLRSSQRTLHELAAKSPDRMTVGDLQRAQEAVYMTAVMDQRMNASGEYSEDDFSSGARGVDHGYLRTGAVHTYRDLMWGTGRPELNGQRQDLYWVSNESGGGHYVLANQTANRDGSRDVGYNPWPDSDGTAFARGADGPGARVVPMSGTAREGQQLRGVQVDQEGRTLPRR